MRLQPTIATSNRGALFDAVSGFGNDMSKKFIQKAVFLKQHRSSKTSQLKLVATSNSPFEQKLRHLSLQRLFEEPEVLFPLAAEILDYPNYP